MSFSQFMELVLYHPELGYYSCNPKIGKRGDFFTSVSVGSCFGLLLARQIRQIQEQLGSPADFAVIEQGAHEGQLAEDILDELGEVRYRIAEPNPQLRSFQQSRFGGRIQVANALAELGPLEAGVYLANELLDALPVDRVCFQEGTWRERRVFLREDGSFEERLASEASMPVRELLPETAPDGFTTEVCPGLRTLMPEIYAAFGRGVVILVDYGMPSTDYFAPERACGTLRCYREHQATDAPFEALGATDITAQVNFSHVAHFSREAGFDVLGYTDQNRFLTGIARPWLQELDGQMPTAESLKLVRQFQTLTQPGDMGRLFKVLVLAKGCGTLELDGLRWTDDLP